MTATPFKDLSRAADSVLYGSFNCTNRLHVRSKAAVSASSDVSFATDGSVNAADAAIRSGLAVTVASAHLPRVLGIDKLLRTPRSSSAVFAKINTVGDAMFMWKLRDVGVRRLNIATCVSGSHPIAPSSATARVAAEFRNERYAMEARWARTTSLASPKESSCKLGVAVKVGDVTLGGHAGYDFIKSKFKDESAGARFRIHDTTITLLLKKRFKVVHGSYHHKVSSHVASAALVTHDFAMMTTQITAGGRYKLDDTTTCAGKIDSDGVLSLSWSQQLGSLAALSVCTRVDVTNLDGDTHDFGIGVTIG